MPANNVVQSNAVRPTIVRPFRLNMNDIRPRHVHPLEYPNTIIGAPDNSIFIVQPTNAPMPWPRPAVYSFSASLPQMVLSCRLCDRRYHDANDLIGIFSDEGQTKKIAPMLMYTMNILVTEQDPLSKYLCKVCYGHLDGSYKFTTTCRTNFLSGMDAIPNLQLKNTFKDEIKKFLTVPAQSMYFNQSTDISDTYKSIVQYVRNPEANPKTFERNLKINVLNDLNPRNGYLQTSSPMTINRPNMGTRSTVTTSSSIGHRNQSVTNRSSSNVVASNQSPTNAVATDESALNAPSTIGHTISNNTNIDHDYHEVQSSTNRFEDDEVICLDDDSDPEVIESAVNPLNLWVSNNIIADNNNQVEKPKTNRKRRVNGLPAPKTLRTLRRLLSINASNTSTYNGSTVFSERPSENSCFSNVASEDVTITPDIPMLNFADDDGEPTSIPSQDPATLSNQCDVTSNFGLHFLYKADETVDLTSDSPKRTPGSRKRKVKSIKSIPPPKKKFEPTTKVAIKVMEKKKPLPVPTPPAKANVTSVGNSTATEKAVASVQKRYSKRLLLTAPNKTKQVCHNKDPVVNIKKVLTVSSHKLGSQAEGCWIVNINIIEISSYQCPICEKFFYSSISRQNHELSEHVTLPELPIHSTDSTSELENCLSSTEQQEFLIYLQLVKKTSKMSPIELLAHQPNLLQSLKTVGNEISSFDCHFCKYTTSRKFILWAHMSTCHNIFNSEKKSSTYCILCNRVLNKRIRYLNHINTCIATQLKSENTLITGSSSIKCHTCYICNANINSNSDLEIHLWNHISIQRNSN